MTRLAWGSKVSPEFRAAVLRICKAFEWSEEHASWLMACMHFESGGTFSPSIKNVAGSGATGLIQFMPKTAIGLGTTVDKLAAMTAIEQLAWVQKYFQPYAKRINSLADMYMAILLPSAIWKADDAPLFSDGVAYRQNSALDADRNGVVTKEEATARVGASLRNGLKEPNVFTMQDQPKGETTMAPFLAAAIPALIQALPDFAKIFKSPDVAERNVEAVVKATDIIMQATGASNVQEAVEKVQADPVVAQAANQAVRMSTADLADIVERVNAMDQGNIKAARDYNTAEPFMINTRWMKLKFIHVLSLLFVGFSGSFVMMHWYSLTPELKGAVITLMIIAGWNGVRDYWMGSSEGSARKTELLRSEQ